MRWQRTARRVALDLHRKHRFDVAHHVTLTNDWLHSGLSALPDVPFVWGPVCGVRRPPLRHWSWFGPRGAAQQALGTVVVTAGRAMFGRNLARRAAVLVTTGSTTRTARYCAHPNEHAYHCSLDLSRLPAPPTSTVRVGHERQAVFVGRLLPIKGLRLALAAMTHPAAADWVLDIYGDGPDRAYTERFVARNDLGGRVRLHGRVERDVVLASVAYADALLFPSFHDNSAWVIGEALSLGRPVVCLQVGDAGEHDEGRLPGVYAVPYGRDLPGAVARTLASVEAPAERSLAFERSALVASVDRWYHLAVERGAAP